MWVAKALFKGTIISFLIAGSFAGIIGASAYNRLNDVTIETEKLIIEPKPTIIYDKNGDKMAEFDKDTKDPTKYDEIPIEIIDAITSIEDRAFFDHIGINPKAIARAGVAYLANKGSITQGGSTITQQLVKTIYVGNETSFQRKINEAVLATTLEKNVSKEEIITAYLSHIDFGYQSFGVKNAVETYFGQTLEEFKQEDELTRIIKAAYIAGLPQAPYGKSPYDENGQKKPTFDNALERRNAVLHAMLVEKKITEEQYDEAIKNKDLLVLNKVNRVHKDQEIKYPDYVHYVLSETAEKLGLSSVEEAMYSGMKIYTSFDPEVYTIMRKAYNDESNFPENAKDGTKVESASVIVNPQNGEIYAMIGSREENEGFLTHINRAFQTKRQPGSSFKPLISFAPALEFNVFKKDSMLVDQKGYNFGGGYVVKDWDNYGRGRVTMKEAIRQSWNIPAVYALQQTGINRAREFVSRLGINLGEKDIYLPIALGGLEVGTSTLEMADAYQAFANGGYRIEAHTIKRMVNANGEVVFEAENKLTDKNRVMKKSTAKDMNEMLRNAVTSGTGGKANVEGHQVAGKTGTTEYVGSKDGNSDVWFVGYTKDYVTAVWMGYDSTTPDRYLSKATGSGWAASMFKEMMTPLLKIRPDYVDGYKEKEEEKEENKIPQIHPLEVESTYDEEQSIVRLTWEAKEDTMYRVYRDGEEVTSLVTKKGEFVDMNLTPGALHSYEIVGFELASGYKNYESVQLRFRIKEIEEVEETEDLDEEPIEEIPQEQEINE